MDRFHRWCNNAVYGLGIACLWYEIARLFDYFLNARSLGIIVGMFFIGWAVSYDDKYNKKPFIWDEDDNKKD